MNKIQFTFYNPTHKYKPITVTITPKDKEKMSSMYQRAYEKMKAERHWTDKDVQQYEYTKWRFRQVDEKGQPIRKVEKNGKQAQKQT